MGGAEESMGAPGPSLSQYGSRYSMSRTCGHRDIISLVIPRIGDNTAQQQGKTVDKNNTLIIIIKTIMRTIVTVAPSPSYHL
jgi:hypothetical protein